MLLTYAEIAARQGISITSARQLVRRRRWPKTVGNDGTARIDVPVDAVSAAPPDPPPPRLDPRDVQIAALQAENRGLMSLIDEVRASRDAAERRAADAETQATEASARLAEATAQLAGKGELIGELRAQLAASQDREGGALARLVRDLLRR